MSELTVNSLIKIIIGLVVVLAVVGGLYLAFKGNILESIKNFFSIVK